MSAAGSAFPFSSAANAQAATTLGVWIFLGSEAMLFGGLMLAYMVARLHHGVGFAAASAELDFALGTANTAVLLTSSFTVALADGFAEARRRRPARGLLLLSGGLGLAFLAIKAVEYGGEASRGLLPVFGLPFAYDGPDPAGAALFFDFYVALTGLHAVHLASGIAVLGLIAARWRRVGHEQRVRRVRGASLYWHFIDVVWVFLYPLLYLIDR
jgi:cytochrome c oxidase subunit 3